MNNEIPPKNNDSTLTKINLEQYHKGNVITTPEQINNKNNQAKPDDTPKSKVEVYQDQIEAEKPKIKKSSIIGTTFMITNICLGTTIYTFATRAKRFGLVWLLVFCLIVAAINYWSIILGVYASSKFKEDDFSELTEKILGKKMRHTLLLYFIVMQVLCALFLYFILYLEGLFKVHFIGMIILIMKSFMMKSGGNFILNFLFL